MHMTNTLVAKVLVLLLLRADNSFTTPVSRSWVCCILHYFTEHLVQCNVKLCHQMTTVVQPRLPTFQRATGHATAASVDENC